MAGEAGASRGKGDVRMRQVVGTTAKSHRVELRLGKSLDGSGRRQGYLAGCRGKGEAGEVEMAGTREGMVMEDSAGGPA